MKKILLAFLSAILLAACSEDDGKIYVGEHNYYVMAPSEVSEQKGTFDYQEKLFPRYYIYRADEWPREDLSDVSSYDLPRIQFYWANMSDKSHPMYSDYERRAKIWSMKTDGTDLRLVVEDPLIGLTGKGKMVRSPNNRYLAYSRAVDGEAVYDLETGEIHSLTSRRGPNGFLWAEDSSYLYYLVRGSHGPATYRWDAETHEKTPVDISIRDTGVIIEGIRYNVSDVGVGTFDEKSNERISSIPWHETIENWREARAEYRSISPLGKYAWVASKQHRFFIDIENQTAEVNNNYMPYILGLDGRFATGVRHAMVMDVRDNETKQAWKWRPLGMNRSLEQSSLYNSLANDGTWFKEVE
ncbi:membrane lipoprotein lipid attachment site-containing protein [Vibrio sp. ZSDE26]|uniref:Type IV secretion system putative lipoprotein virB7 n=1 Tax=Vibrio amylolyticus TaxID=2847292 RepID=A0A9X1XQ70_9VIBR|nr:membrane lipoprotein lipid attachment site-containing protein [Vibrio amylolyticus]MCK6263544.1 membrane lipoprotein lipid attachment site-containing protein [Vibrio amylolyticus]